MPNLTGKTLLNRYNVQEFLGRGGMAEVYKVWDSQRMTYLAMKVLLEDLALDRVFIRRFTREANTLAKLQHPNIVRFYGFKKVDRLAFILMDYIEGESLKHFIHDADGKSMPYGQIRVITRSVCGALHYAHNQGLVHCDIKPANIMINQNGIVQLADFGIARMSDAATATMVGAGTPAYMAPEQVRGEDPTPQTDIYALGIVLYEMFTGGERPFTGDQAQTTGGTSERVRWEQLHLPPPSPRQWNPSLSSEIESVILKCLEKNPNQRYGSALELVNALELALEETQDEVPFILPKPKTREKKPIQTSPQKAKKRGSIAIGVALLAIFLIGFGWLIGGGDGGGINTSVSTDISHPVIFTKTSSPPIDLPELVTATAIAIDTALPTVILPTETSAPLQAGALSVSPRDGMVMVYIPAGDFLMGGSADDAYAECLKFHRDHDKCRRDWYTDEEPIHTVYLEAFWIDQFEVTTAMFADFLNARGNQSEGGATWLRENLDDDEVETIVHSGSGWHPVSGYENHPVNFVTWYGAKAYCEWAGRRLPSEAEWEKVASWHDDTKTKTMYPWGNNFECEKLNSHGGDCDGYLRTSPVGSFPAGISFYGAYDMAGNIREWTADWYDIYPGGSASASANDKNKRVIRGGSWYNFEDLSRSSFRYMDAPTKAYQNIGFRCVRTP